MEEHGLGSVPEPLPELVPKETESAKCPEVARKRLPPRPQAHTHEEPLLGRGGPQHKYLQNLIKRVAEERGYLSTIEKQVLDGEGSIDISLEKEGKKIACEISVTTTPEQELGNVEKCIKAGYDDVIVLTSDMKHLRRLKETVTAGIKAPDLSKIHFFLPEEFIAFLDAEAAQSAGTETTVKGYKVKVNYTPVTEAEQKSRRQAIAKVILQSMQRMKKH